MTPNAALDGRQTLMEQEAGEAAAAVRRMLDANRAAFAGIGRRLRASPPPRSLPARADRRTTPQPMPNI